VDKDRGSSFSTAVHGQGFVAQGRRQGKVRKGSGFSSLLSPIHPLVSLLTITLFVFENSARPRTTGTLLHPTACSQTPTMRCTSIRADAESFTRRRDVTDAMGRRQQQLLGRQSRLHALGQSDASSAAPSMKRVRTPPMTRLLVPMWVSVLSCQETSRPAPPRPPGLPWFDPSPADAFNYSPRLANCSGEGRPRYQGAVGHGEVRRPH
jgi:hypothetical protein